MPWLKPPVTRWATSPSSNRSSRSRAAVLPVGPAGAAGRRAGGAPTGSPGAPGRRRRGSSRSSRLTASGSARTSCPATRTTPAVGGTTPASTRIVVDLPAPLRPSSAVACPAYAARSTPATASTSPNRTCSPTDLDRRALVRPTSSAYRPGHRPSASPECTSTRLQLGAGSTMIDQIRRGRTHPTRRGPAATAVAWNRSPYLRGQLVGPLDEGVEADLEGLAGPVLARSRS